MIKIYVTLCFLLKATAEIKPDTFDTHADVFLKGTQGQDMILLSLSMKMITPIAFCLSFRRYSKQ